MLGHGYPVLLGFGGGKGVATGAGAALALFPAGVGLAALAWAITFFTLRYASVASLAAGAAFLVAAIALGRAWPVIAFAALAFGFVALRHRANIARLRPERSRARVCGVRHPNQVRDIRCLDWRARSAKLGVCSDRGARVKAATSGAPSSRRAADSPGCAACRTRELERIVATVESDLERFPTKDSLLEHLARLHFDARARQEAVGLEEARRHPDSARRIVETAIFERRYNVKLTEALDLGGPVGDEESDQANLYVEGVLRRLGIVYQTLDRGRWLIESDGCAVYLQHYAGERVLDVYAPIMPLDSDDDHLELFRDLLGSNGGSIAGGFYGICSFSESGSHLCACGRLATAHLVGPEVIYVLNSVVALAERLNAD